MAAGYSFWVDADGAKWPHRGLALWWQILKVLEAGESVGK